MLASLRESARTFVLEAGAFAFYLLLALLYSRPLAKDLAGTLPAGPDPLVDLWTVDWLSGHLVSSEIFGGNIFHPFPHAVLHSDLSLGTALFLVPLRPLFRDPVPLFNVGLLLALAFSGWAFQRLAVVLTGRRSAGLLAGVLAAFGSHQMFHLYHLNLLSTGWIAVFVLGLLRLLERPRPAAALSAALGFTLAVQSSGYYAVACILIGFVFGVAHARRLLERRRLGGLLAAAVLASVLTTPMLLAFRSLREREGDALRRDPELSVSMAFSPGQDLGSRGYLYGGLLGRRGEQLFPGLLTLALTGIAVAKRRAPAGFLAAAAALLCLVSLGPRLRLFEASVPLPYAILFSLPPLDSMRHPYTFAAVATLLLSVTAGVGWAALAVSARPLAGAAVVAAAVLETLGPGLRVRHVPKGLPPAYEALVGLPPGAALDLPVLNPEALLWAARHHRPVVNGEGAFTPLYVATLDRYVRNHWLRRTPADLDASKPARFLREHFDLRYVVVPTGRRRGLSDLAAAFDRSKSFRLVAEARDGDRIYACDRSSP